MRIILKIKLYYFLIWLLMTIAIAAAIYKGIEYASMPDSNYTITIFSFFNCMFHQPFIWAAFFIGWRLQVNRKVLKRPSNI